MTKQQEIDELAAIINRLPKRSYLRAVLIYIAPQFESDIRSDIETLPSLREIEREIQEARQQLSKLRIHIDTQRQYVVDLESRTKQAKDALEHRVRAMTEIKDRLAQDAAWYRQFTAKE